jgi:2-phospho-L-lactate guanylyltransferase
MRIVAVVPVKGAVNGKARLAPVLTPAQRAALVRAMVWDVLDALQLVDQLAAVAVTSPDPLLLAFVAQRGAKALPEPPGVGGLNAALAAAVDHLTRCGTEAVLIIPGDLPQLSPADVAALLRPPLTPPRVRAAPAADGGTTALLLVPPTVITPAFGEESFVRHRAAALTAGVPFESCERPRLGWDVDRPADLWRVRHSPGAVHTRAVLRTALRPAIPDDGDPGDNQTEGGGR